jgi:hypothetical protein
MGAVVDMAMNNGRGPWCIFQVVDSTGEVFLGTGSYADYEPAFRKHAAWWIRYRTRPQAYKDTDSAGRPLRQPIKPCRIVIEPCE